MKIIEPEYESVDWRGPLAYPVGGFFPLNSKLPTVL